MHRALSCIYYNFVKVCHVPCLVMQFYLVCQEFYSGLCDRVKVLHCVGFFRNFALKYVTELKMFCTAFVNLCDVLFGVIILPVQVLS